MTHGYRLAGVLFALVCLVSAGQVSVSHPRSSSELKKIILHSQKMGPHGMGYGEQSLVEMSQTITPADIPELIKLLDDPDFHMDAQIALTSQCEAALQPTKEAAGKNGKFDYDEAADVMDFISRFNRCSPQAKEKARAMRVESQRIVAEQQARILQESKKKAEDDDRIQRNSFKMLNPEQKKTLTRAEREEVFKRSVKNSGLENPKTQAQKDLVDRMYRTMVLDEPPKSKNNK